MVGMSQSESESEGECGRRSACRRRRGRRGSGSGSPLSVLYVEWCSLLKVELKEKSALNVEQRMSKLTEMVNSVVAARCGVSGGVSGDAVQFAVSSSCLFAIRSRVDFEIESWRGVEIEVCKLGSKKSFASYQATARNWFNRNKAKIYGNHLFYDVVFGHIVKVRWFGGG